MLKKFADFYKSLMMNANSVIKLCCGLTQSRSMSSVSNTMSLLWYAFKISRDPSLSMHPQCLKIECEFENAIISQIIQDVSDMKDS